MALFSPREVKLDEEVLLGQPLCGEALQKRLTFKKSIKRIVREPINVRGLIKGASQKARILSSKIASLVKSC